MDKMTTNNGTNGTERTLQRFRRNRYTKNTLFIVMELMEGGELYEEIVK